MEIKVMNVNQALSEGLHWLRQAGIREKSRNGPVLVSPEPVTTTYRFPMERVLFSPRRDANPFFHLMEALWMLAGRNDLAWPLFFNSRFKEFSDDGVTTHGAYGYRWRRSFATDQLQILARELRLRPESRRCVLQMWNAPADLPLAVGERLGKDVPCNTHAYFLAKDGVLETTVCCRSNDMLWGAYGSNAVHFSILAEYIAAASGLALGPYHQFSNNFHLYPGVLGITDEGMVNGVLYELAADSEDNDHYASDEVRCSPIINVPVDEWDLDLKRFMAKPFDLPDSVPYSDVFFPECAIPMYRAWKTRKQGKVSGAKELKPMQDNYGDWYRACWEWIERREARKVVLAADFGYPDPSIAEGLK